MFDRIGIGVIPLFFLWLAATLCLGGVAAPYGRLHVFLAALVAGGTLFRSWKSGSWNRTSPSRTIRWVLAGIALFLLLALFTLLPLPQGVLQAYAPFTMRLTFGTLATLGIRKEFYYPISLDPRATTDALAHLAAFLLLFAAAIAVLGRPERRTRLAQYLVLSAAAIALFGMIHRFSGSTRMFWWIERGWTFFGPFVNANHAGSLLAIAAALALPLSTSRRLSRTDRFAFRFLLGLIVLGLLFTGSRSAVLTLAVVATAHLAAIRRNHTGLRDRWGLPILGLAFGTAVAWNASFLPRLAATAENLAVGKEFRVSFWAYAWELWQRSPLTGIGLGAFGRLSPMMAGDSLFLHAEHAENDYLELLCSTGVVGFLLAALLIFALSRRILRTLRSADVSNTTRGFALAILAYLVSSFFVFNAPLPAHQILLALLLAGFLASNDTPLLADRWARSAIGVGIILTSLLGIRGLLIGESDPEARRGSNTLSPALSNADRRGALLIRAGEAEAAILNDPLDGPAIYSLATASAELGDRDRARKAFEIAVRLAPFDLFRRVELIRRLAASDPRYAVERTEEILESDAPLSADTRFALHLEAALHAVALKDGKRVRDHLESVEAVSEDWRIPLIRMIGAEEVLPSVRESWKRAKNQGIDGPLWDRFFLSALRARKLPVDLRAVASLKWDRPDLGDFLRRLSSLDPGSREMLSARLDLDPPVDFLRPNTPESELNARIDGRNLDVRVIRNQASVDIYWVRVNLSLSPQELSVRMIVESTRRISKQLVLEMDGKPFLTRESARPLPNGRWELMFRNIGHAIPESIPAARRTITGIGFTPLEKDGRYMVEAIEIFVDSVR